MGVIVSWKKPPHPSCKLNIYGSSLSNPGPFGGGIINRDPQGSLVAAKSISFGFCSNFQAEVLAMLKGLKLCHHLSLGSVIVESDSKALIDILLGHSSISWRHAMHIRQIQLLLLPAYCVQHVFREVNLVADALAKISSQPLLTSSFSLLTLLWHKLGLYVLDQRSFPSVRLTHL